MATKKNLKQNVPSKHDEIFHIVWNNETNSYYIVVGEFKISEKQFKKIQDAENYIASKPYKLIFNTFQILMYYAEKNKKDNTQNKTDAKSN